ncbi:PRC-barrel domain-containing protein [Arabiibacter massiliensis]|uniref:PRC-barrel domain-containing protein n=1 Tax=Arabiibacter massiliensis TaxID=1870985 RepID=UPI0009BAC6B2|nr:PRC-barrel domain-containing protein [Arabiibacter massiliensis]
MASKLITTSELTGVRVVGGKNGQKRIGKVRRFVFHPKEKRCVGFIVKRPDLLWMFRRKDKFVSIQGYDLVDGRIAIRDVPEATDRAACKALGVNYDDCVLWVGLPVMCEDGTAFGTVGDVTFNRITGTVESFDTDSGATANALLGKRTVPAELIVGFRRGMGAQLATVGQEGAQTDDVVLGAILVSDEVKELAAEGGVAEKAGAATAVAMDKVHTTVDKAKPVVSEAAKKTGEVVNKGAYATGKQIAKSKTMFSDFKEEYDKARGPKPAKGEQAIAKSDGAAKPAAAKKPAAPKKKPAPKKNMFAAFKDEFDKARKDD